ncbi:DUF3379 family protein [Glaciecola sp. SC05]|uniref:DUF3379 family protein n=1 Tax=Glaciecola sp. SC05 TaxID=1987355 RepID=UPI00352782D0
MDDLNFRRTIYADPYTKDPEILEAAKSDPKKQAFWDEVRMMEASLEQAMNVPVPEGLADKLILRQSMDDFQQQKKRRPWYLALAASVFLASILSVSLLMQGPTDLKSDVYAHMSHMSYELNKSGKVDLAMVNDKLATYNGQVNEGIGEIVSANYCYLDSIKSLHLIIKGKDGLASLFVMPSEISKTIDDDFSNDVYTGSAFLLESAKIIIVGETSAQVEELKAKAKTLLSFSI